MRITLFPRVLAALLAFPLLVNAAHPFLCTDSNGGKVAVVSADGTIEWEYSCTHPQDCWALANGNFLFCHTGGAIEMTRDKKIAWEYKAGEHTEVHACQPLPNGNVLVVENGPSRLLEIDRAGKIAKEIKLTLAARALSASDVDQFSGGAQNRRRPLFSFVARGEHQVEELDWRPAKVSRLIPVPG